jgi:tRNA A37 threonylcarbamoyladenosine dehydratase
MLNAFSRTELLLGADGLARLKAARVAVFGIGGVGSYTAEALVRSGVGALDLIDDDKVCLTNLNRQLCATRSTVGHMKVEVMKARLLDINPTADVVTRAVFFTPETAPDFDFTRYAYVVDAVDTVTAKLALVACCRAANVPVISCMGAGNKLDPTRFEVADIYATSVCPLAKVMRKELRARGIPSLKVVYSKELPLTPREDLHNSCKANCVCPPGTIRKCTARNQVPGSVAFVPPVAGLILAGEVIKDLATHG